LFRANENTAKILKANYFSGKMTRTGDNSMIKGEIPESTLYRKDGGT